MPESPVGWLIAVASRRLTDRIRAESPNGFQRAAHDWVTLAVPVIAAIHGNCLGGGLQIALGADIRVVADDVLFCMAEPSLGIVPDLGGTKRLVDLVEVEPAH